MRWVEASDDCLSHHDPSSPTTTWRSSSASMGWTYKISQTLSPQQSSSQGCSRSKQTSGQGHVLTCENEQRELPAKNGRSLTAAGTYSRVSSPLAGSCSRVPGLAWPGVSQDRVKFAVSVRKRGVCLIEMRQGIVKWMEFYCTLPILEGLRRGVGG
jgi:hypothetical protein